MGFACIVSCDWLKLGLDTHCESEDIRWRYYLVVTSHSPTGVTVWHR
jgi:hypothetical protein